MLGICGLFIVGAIGPCAEAGAAVRLAERRNSCAEVIAACKRHYWKCQRLSVHHLVVLFIGCVFLCRLTLLQLENSAKQHEASLRAERDELFKKLRVYESLEAEIDAAVLRVAGDVLNGQVLSQDGTAGGGSGLSIDGQVARSIGGGLGAPVIAVTAAERRVRQCVQLAQQLLQSEKLRASLALELAGTQERLQKAMKDCERLEEDVSTVGIAV
jgi:hypothetical protein